MRGVRVGRFSGLGVSLGVSLAVALMALPALGAQDNHGRKEGKVETTVPEPVAEVPFGVGELARYEVKLGVFSVGEGSLSVPAIDTVRGHPTYRVMMHIQGGVPFYQMNDTLRSWIDTRSLISRRFRQDQQEGSYERHRQLEFFPEEGRYHERGKEDKEEELASDEPLDDLSFVYFVRTLPLKVGETYTFERYFKEDGNPVTIKVLRKDRIKVPAGEFETIVVQPIIQTDGIFSEGGRAEIHFTDDERRDVVYMKTRIPVVGNLTLHLKELNEGTPLSGGASGPSGGE